MPSATKHMEQTNSPLPPSTHTGTHAHLWLAAVLVVLQGLEGHRSAALEVTRLDDLTDRVLLAWQQSTAEQTGRVQVSRTGRDVSLTPRATDSPHTCLGTAHTCCRLQRSRALQPINQPASQPASLPQPTCIAVLDRAALCKARVARVVPARLHHFCPRSHQAVAQVAAWFRSSRRHPGLGRGHDEAEHSCLSHITTDTWVPLKQTHPSEHTDTCARRCCRCCRLP